MNIALISDDRDLKLLCMEALAEARRSTWALQTVTSQLGGLKSDFYIWDVDWRKSLPERPDLNPARQLFLVDRDDLSRFRRSGRGAGANVLIKPVTRGLLAVFLDVAFASCQGNDLNVSADSVADYYLHTSLKLQERDQDRSRFLANIAHDLRVPITALLGYCGLLLDEKKGLDRDQRTILQHMQNSAIRLSHMASAIFQLSVEGHCAFNVNFHTEEIRRCVDQALHEVALLMIDKQIRFVTQVAASESDLYFDKELIERVLVNILENSCRFTPCRGTIDIRGYSYFWERRRANASLPVLTERRFAVANIPNSYRVDIRNSGTAIPPDTLEHLFEQYTTLESTREYSGTGLGLAICRTIISQHFGRIWAENTGQGPRFSFVLPKNKNSPGSPQPFPRTEAEQGSLNCATS
jgi:signal transduction histidine kinase